MDEPTSALDPISTLRVEELVQELKRKLFYHYGYTHATSCTCF